MQIETLKPDLSRAIQWLNLSFSGWYNRLRRRRGPLFQGRFKAVLHHPEESGLTINLSSSPDLGAWNQPDP